MKTEKEMRDLFEIVVKRLKIEKNINATCEEFKSRHEHYLGIFLEGHFIESNTSTLKNLKGSLGFRLMSTYLYDFKEKDLVKERWPFHKLTDKITDVEKLLYLG